MGTNPQTKNYKIAGIIILIAGLLINPWFIAWFSGYSFSTTVFTAILLVSLIFIFSGFGIIIIQKRFFNWVIEKYRDFAVIVLNVLILFGLINVFASLLIKKPTDNKPDITYFYSPQDLFNDSIEFIRKVYPGKSDKDIEGLLNMTYPYANHPVLEFQERVQDSKYYNIGFEGIRFDNKVTRSNVSSGINGSVWVMGGSTTFGQGVSDNETISAYLNQLDTSNTYINFGVHAYHQGNEINKMLLLLKKGYLPKKVIFIDGLNDMIRMIETNFHPLETPSLAKSAYSSDYNIATRPSEISLLEKMPVTRWLRTFIEEEDEDVVTTALNWDTYDNVYDPSNLYNTDPQLHFQSSLLRSPYNPIDSTGLKYVTRKLREYYQSNYFFIEKIANAFNFEFTIYYQPQAVLSDQNPFWRDQVKRKETPLYRNFEFIIPRIKEQILVWNYPGFIDISGVMDSCPSCLVDLTHYSPEMNRKIAEAILAMRKRK